MSNDDKKPDPSGKVLRSYGGLEMEPYVPGSCRHGEQWERALQQIIDMDLNRW